MKFFWRNLIGSMPKLFGDHVHLAFIGKESLGIAGRAHMAAGDLVRVNHVFFDEHVRNLVRPSGQVRAVEKSVGFERAVSAAVEDKTHTVGDQGAVFFYTGFNVDDRSVPRDCPR